MEIVECPDCHQPTQRRRHHRDPSMGHTEQFEYKCLGCGWSETRQEQLPERDPDPRKGQSLND